MIDMKMKNMTEKHIKKQIVEPITQIEPIIFDLDDFCESNHRLDLIFKLKEKNPELKINLFTIIGKCSIGWLNKIRQYNWIQLIPHGLYHNTSYEFSNYTYTQAIQYLQNIEPLGLIKGFKAPGWQISDETYIALLEKGYWIADQSYNNYRRPKALKCYLLDSKPFIRIHGHIQNVCGNGLEEKYDFYKSLHGQFKFIDEIIPLKG